MRKLKLQMQMTVDGFISGSNGEMDWMIFNWDDELKKYVTDLSEPVDCIVLGRKLAQGFIPHWASIPEGEDAKGIEKINKTQKVVFTKTLESSEWKNTVLAKGNLVAEINHRKSQIGQDIIAYGGGTFVSNLIRADLIDEYHLFINPAVLGTGMTIFKGLDSKIELTLKSSLTFPCGIVLLNYEPIRNIN